MTQPLFPTTRRCPSSPPPEHPCLNDDHQLHHETRLDYESRIVEDTASELVVNLRTGKQPVELSREPEIQALISLVDVEELLT
jgi:hypothetical protein